MSQIPSEGEYCGECPCRTWGGYRLAMCTHFNIVLKVAQDNKRTRALRLPECLKEKPRILPTAKFNHEACAALWEQIGNDFMGEGRGE